MSEKIRRQKDLVKNATKSYLNATEVYQDYLDASSPVQITYYQIADEASRTDTSLEDTREVIGSQSSLYYYRIKHVLVYGIASPLDILSQLTQRGLEDFITGDFVMSPDLGIRPRSGEFFSFEDEATPELNQHLFQITDVQYDRATSSKFHKCSYKLYPKDTDSIYSQVTKTFVYDPNKKGNDLGVGDSVLITEEEAAQQENLTSLVDGLIDKYESLFYNPSMDTFTYQKAIHGDNKNNQYEYYWSPYICHFLYKNKVMEKSATDFLTEIYVQDINETIYPGIYSEDGYRKSIYFAAEQGSPSVLDNVACSFMEISAYDLNKPLNLPFFSSAEKYKLVDVYYEENKDFWLGAFHLFYGNESQQMFTADPKYFYNCVNAESFWNHLAETYGVDDTGENIAIPDDKQDSFINKIFYGIKDNNKFDIQEMQYTGNGDNPDLCDIQYMLTPSVSYSEETHSDLLISILHKYFSEGKLYITEDLIKNIDEYYHNNSLRTYLLMPILIFILQQNTTFNKE